MSLSADTAEYWEDNFGASRQKGQGRARDREIEQKGVRGPEAPEKKAKKDPQGKEGTRSA